jgi:acyl-CoA reductase-like NAD-dependent aldehyde dehydrogenase
MATPIQKPAPKVNIDFQSFSHIIVGKPCKSRNSFRGINPATKKRLWEVPLADGQDVERAVRAANAAQRRWAQKSWKERQQVCLRFKDVYSNYVDELTELLILETGKPSNWARSEVGSCGYHADYHAKLPLPNGESFDDKERQVTTKYTPLGVVAAILPWNSPLAMCFGKLFPALVAGNAVIFKPSPFTPYSTVKAVEIAQQVFAPGLVQVLAGDDSLGASLVEHPEIHKIAFTGSMPTGKKIMRAAAATLKRITLEVS